MGKLSPRRPAIAPRATSRGFTLIELLVAVAIIALLIAILLPSLSRARARAKAVVCQTNLRTLTRAGLLYSADWNDAVAPSDWTSQPLAPSAAIPDGLPGSPWLPYLDKARTTTDSSVAADIMRNHMRIRTCPSTVGNPTYAVANQLTPIWYGINAPSNSTNFRLSRLDHPTETALFGDVAWKSSPSQTNLNASSNFYYPSYPPQPPAAPKSSIPQYSYYVFDGRHDKHGNVSWYDGHVSSELPSMPADSPYFGLMSSGGTGYLTPLPSSTTWSNFTSSPLLDQYFFYNKVQQKRFF